MSESAEELERFIDVLRTDVRRAVTRGDRASGRRLRAELRAAEAAWYDALAEIEDGTPLDGSPLGDGDGDGDSDSNRDSDRDSDAGPREPDRALRNASAEVVEAAGDDGAAPGPLLPLREQVHQALALLGAPAAPRLIVAVHEAFSGGEVPSARLTSLRRDEERSFRTAPHSRPYYLCAALTADLLAPARGLLAISTWPLATRIIGPLSPRVDFLTAAARLAEQLQRIPDPGPAATRLLWRFATSIPGAASRPEKMTPVAVAAAAQAELAIHLDADRSHREAGAARARSQLDDVAQLFGSRLQTVRGTGS